MPKNRIFNSLRNDYNKEGYNFYGFDKDGFYRNGLDKDGFGRDGFSVDGLDREGYDRDGFRVVYDYGQYKAPGRILSSNTSSLSPEKNIKKRKLSANQAARANAATPPPPPPPPPPLLPLSPQMPPLHALLPHHTHTRPPSRSYLNTRSRSLLQPNSKSRAKTKKNNNHSKLNKLYEELIKYKNDLNVKMTKVNKRINEIENIIFKKPQNRSMTRHTVRQPLKVIQPVAQPIQATVQSNEDGDQMQFGNLDNISAGDIFNAPDRHHILRPGDLGYKY
jgi:hypothetical protein